MVVHISTIDEVRDMLIKLNINERDVHKVLSSLQMRDNWLQYLSQKIDVETSTAADEEAGRHAALDHAEIEDQLDTMIRQHSDPASPSVQQQQPYAADLLGSTGFLGESYVPRVQEVGASDSSSEHRRETHVCSILGPNPKVMIAHMGTKEIDDSLLERPSSLKPRSSTVSSTGSALLIDGCRDAPSTVEESRVEDDENSSSLRHDSYSTSSSSSDHSQPRPLPDDACFDNAPETLVKDLSATHTPCPDVYVVKAPCAPPNPKFCVQVMTESLRKKVLSSSGLAFFTHSCAVRAAAAAQRAAV